MQAIKQSRGPSPLGRPIWSALTQAQAALAEISGPARRYPADMAPFAATADLAPASVAALAPLVPPDGGVALFEEFEVPAPHGLAVVRHAAVLQMVAGAATPAPAPGFAPLGEDDVADMLELVRLTEPGPFAARTHRLGRYLGLRRDGRLIAMAGERMRLDGFTEISAVCTHPDARGQGLGAQAVTAIGALIRADCAVPFLHVFANNAPAIALYERLGFTLRRELRLTVLRRAG
jgi:predicted GNAT family acetyltransferase